MRNDVGEKRESHGEVRRAGDQYRSIFNAIPIPVLLLSGEDGTIVECNLSATAVYGYDKEELVGTSFLSLFEEGDTRASLSLLNPPGLTDRAKQRRKDGTVIYVNIRTAASEHLGEKILLVTASDVTARLMAEQQLIQASKMATLGEMASAMAHELNQPLTVIRTACSFLKRKVIRDEPIEGEILKTMSEEIDCHLDRASRIINHMREFGRKPEVSKEKTDVNQVLIKSLDFFKQQLKLREIELVLDLGAELPPVWADPNRLEQVFINLLINARDAIERRWEESNRVPGEKRILVKTALEESLVTTTITDNGTGIPDGLLDKIFEPFFTTKKVGKGTGLGLSISYGIVQDYDGTIRVKTKVGEGSSFTVQFPPGGDSPESHEIAAGR